MVTGNDERNSVGGVITVTHRGNVMVGRTSSHGLSFVYNNTGRRNIITGIPTRRCDDISRVLTLTRRGNRTPFVVVYSRVRSDHGLNTVVEATRTYNIRNIVVPGHEGTKLGFVITGATYNTLRCIGITEISGLTSAVRSLGGGGV